MFCRSLCVLFLLAIAKLSILLRLKAYDDHFDIFKLFFNFKKWPFGNLSMDRRNSTFQHRQNSLNNRQYCNTKGVIRDGNSKERQYHGQMKNNCTDRTLRHIINNVDGTDAIKKDNINNNIYIFYQYFFSYFLIFFFFMIRSLTYLISHRI